MQKLARPLFILLLIVSATVIVATTGQLPEQIASHFGAGGVPNGWMSRQGYLLFMMVFAVGIPVMVVLAMGVLPRWKTGAINIPNRDYWLAPARRDDTLGWLGAHACWLGSLLAVFIAALHLLLIEANALQPPQLPLRPFILLMVAFLLGMGVWAATLMLHFRQRS
jgi:uncharacterized membrane protein